MKLKDIDIAKTIENARNLLAEEKQISPALKAVIELLLMMLMLLSARYFKNSSNSSIPPSQDPNRKKALADGESARKAGGQKGHKGTTLSLSPSPDKVIEISMDVKTLPPGEYKHVGYETHQVVDIQISRIVTEYRAEMVEDAAKKRYTAPFPVEAARTVQYGSHLKSHAVYLSQFQLLPYKRIEDYFESQMNTPLSAGTLFNFNKEAYRRLESFDQLAKQKLIESALIHADETSINVKSKRLWLHAASNNKWTYFYPHVNRGTVAMDEIGILPRFKGILCHDHWKPYYTYEQCSHALCNAHHLRELEAIIQCDNHQWAKDMQALLKEMNNAVHTANGQLEKNIAHMYRNQYRMLLQHAQKECPEPDAPAHKKRGRIKKTKARNLLERFINYEDDILRWLEIDYLPFTNNQAENDIRMTKVQQKISGCFRSIEGAKIFCRVRSYLLTAQKHGMMPNEALESLFKNNLPDFCRA